MSYRAIQSSVPYSERLAGLSDGAERLWWHVLAVSDAWGRLPGSLPKLRALAIPLMKISDARLRRLLREIVDAGLVFIYTCERGDAVIQVERFEENQPKNVTRFRANGSKYGPPANGRSASSSFPGDSSSLPRGIPESPGESRRTPGLDKRREELALMVGSSSSKDLSLSERSLPTLPDEALSSEPERLKEERAAVARIYEHWRTTRRKSNPRYEKLSEARRQKITTRLREFSEPELIRALDAVESDPWEERSRHDDITTLFKNHEAVDRWLELAADTPDARRTRDVTDALEREKEASQRWTSPRT